MFDDFLGSENEEELYNENDDVSGGLKVMLMENINKHAIKLETATSDIEKTMPLLFSNGKRAVELINISVQSNQKDNIKSQHNLLKELGADVTTLGEKLDELQRERKALSKVYSDLSSTK